MIEVAETIRERERKREKVNAQRQAQKQSSGIRGGVVIIIAMCFYVKCVCFYLLN